MLFSRLWPLAFALEGARASSDSSAELSIRSQFSNKKVFTFEGDSLPAGLNVSVHRVGASVSGTVARKFVEKNVNVSDGFLNLNVPGGQTGKVIECGEVVTDFEVLYADVTTYAILSQAPGVCNGMFFYEDDSQETDIEWLSDPNSKANNGTALLHYTNQAVNGSGLASTFNAAGPADPTSQIHKYRLVWTEKKTEFYLDGVLQRTIKSNVPSKAGRWTWNNWSNGSPNWSVGPPATDATLQISKIVMHYNPA